MLLYRSVQYGTAAVVRAMGRVGAAPLRESECTQVQCTCVCHGPSLAFIPIRYFGVQISVSREQQGKSWVVPDHARAPRLKRQLAALVKAAADGPGGDGAHGHVRRLEWELFITCIEEEMPFIGAATPAGKASNRAGN